MTIFMLLVFAQLYYRSLWYIICNNTPSLLPLRNRVVGRHQQTEHTKSQTNTKTNRKLSLQTRNKRTLRKRSGMKKTTGRSASKTPTARGGQSRLLPFLSSLPPKRIWWGFVLQHGLSLVRTQNRTTEKYKVYGPSRSVDAYCQNKLFGDLLYNLKRDNKGITHGLSCITRIPSFTSY